MYFTTQCLLMMIIPSCNSWVLNQNSLHTHTHTLLHINSGAGVSISHTKKYATESFNTLTLAHNLTPRVVKIKEDYHPSGLFPTKALKPKFEFPCVFNITGFIKRRATLVEKFSIWYVYKTLIKQLSKLQIIEFWAIIANSIKLLQCALLYTLVMVMGSGRGREGGGNKKMKVWGRRT